MAKSGPKENYNFKLEIYHAWKLLHETEGVRIIGKRFNRSGARVAQIVQEMKRRENGKLALDPAPERD